MNDAVFGLRGSVRVFKPLSQFLPVEFIIVRNWKNIKTATRIWISARIRKPASIIAIFVVMLIQKVTATDTEYRVLVTDTVLPTV